MVKRNNLVKIALILICFLSIFAFNQEKHVDEDKNKKLREEILVVYQSNGEQGLLNFVEKQRDRISNKFIDDCAKAALKERSEEWLKICKILAEEKKDEKPLADVLYQTGECLRLISEYKKATDYFEKALSIYLKLGDLVGQGNVYLSKGVIYSDTGDNTRAMDMYQNALPLFEKRKDPQGQGNVYLRKGIVYLRIGDYSKAFEMFYKAFPFFKKAKDPSGQGNIQFRKGLIYSRMGEKSKALEMYDKALPFYKIAGDTIGQGNVYSGKGVIYYVTGDNSKALEMYDKALSFFEKAGELIGQGNIYASRGNIFYRTGDNSRAIEMYDKALPFYKKARDPSGQGNIYLRKGIIYSRTGDNIRALEMYDKALPFYKKSRNPFGQGNVYYSKGNIFYRTGDNSRAIEMYDKALSFYEKVRDPLGQGNIHFRKGIIYSRIGEKSSALEMYNKALLFFQKAENPISQGNVFQYKGDIYYYTGNNSKALELYDKALPLYEKSVEPIGQGNIYLKKGNVYLQTGNYSRALEMYKKALPIFEKAGEPIGKGNVYFNKGNIYFNTGEDPRAIKMYNEALPFYKKAGDIESESNALHSKAMVLTKLGKENEALDLFEIALANLERLRTQTVFSEMKRTFMEKVYKQYEETVLFLLENRYYCKGFKYAESMKSRVFLDQMAEGFVRLEKGLKPALRVEMDRLLGKLSALSRQMQETGGKDEKKLKELKEEYHQVESQFEELLIKIRLENPLYASVNYPQPVTVRNLQADVLKKGETLLSFFSSPEKVYAFIVSKENFKVKQLQVKENEINRYVDRYLHSLKESNTKDVKKFGSKLYEKLFKPLEKYLKKNREIIIVPAGQLETIPFESLIVSKKKPGHPVYLLEKYHIKYIQSASLLSVLRKHYAREGTGKSFIGFGDPVYDYENFKQGKPEQGRLKIFATESTEGVAPPTYYGCRNTQVPEEKFLNENKVLKHSNTEVTESVFSHEGTRKGTRSDTKEKRLTSVPSVSSVAIENEIKEIHRQRYARAGGIMDRLPYSGEEIQTIARLFEKQSLKTVAHLREQAAEANAKAANMKDFDYIHFSCHGLLSDDFQSLVLSQLPPEKSKEDGYFTLNEIMNCDYNARLVVLSACETGSGKMYKGEGVTGLTRAVMYAGTPAVIASLWKVDDIATKELMVKFYRNMLEKNLDKTEALRQAKLELLKNKKYRSPLFWSAFVMYGE